MPPLASYSSLLDGSLRIESSNNTNKHGNGALLVQNGCEFFGQEHQHLKSSHASADFLITSAKDLKGSGTNVLLTGAQSAGVVATTGALNLTASAGDASLSASANFNVNANLKSETIVTTATSTSGGNNLVQSTAGNATLEATNVEARVFGKTLAHLKGIDAVKVECTSGKIDLVGSTSVDAAAPSITSTASTKVDLSAPAINVVAATTALLEAPTVDIGKAASNLNVNISNVGHATNVLGNFNVTGTSTLTGDVAMTNNCVITGNLTVNGATTTITTENLLVKDNIVVLNEGAEAGSVRDSGFLFNRGSSAGDDTTFFWDESDNNFILATTKSASNAATFVVESYAGLKCSNIYASGEISMDTFATKSFSLTGNSSTPVFVPAINKLRGSYEFQIQSDAVDGSVYNYKVIKFASTTSSFASFGVHAGGEDGSQVWVKWDAGEAPKFYHKDHSSSSGTLGYKIKFTTVV
jgi:hypothetical protein